MRIAKKLLAGGSSKIKRITIFFFAVVVMAWLFFSVYKNYIQPIQDKKNLKEAAKILTSRLDTFSLLGQMFLVYLPEYEHERLLRIKPGTLFLQKDSIPQKKANSKNSMIQDIDLLRERLKKIKQTFTEKNIPPPFVAIDQEYGRVQRITSGITNFPSPMAMGAAAHSLNDFELLRWVGFHSCYELREIGINWPLMPLADVQTNPANPVIGTRAFHSKPEIVSEAVSHYSQGLHEAGCMDTLKHFPGHGGTSLDSHKELPIVQKNMKELLKQELLPFSENRDTSYSLMLSHILVPQVDSEIVSRSSFWVQNYLRQMMKFEGLILTDDLGMQAVSPKLNKKNVVTAALKSFEAGADIFLFSNGPDRFAWDVHRELMEKLSSKKIKKKRLISSVEKIIFFKLKLGLYGSGPGGESDTKISNYLKRQADERAYLKKKAPSPRALDWEISKASIQILTGNIENRHDEKKAQRPILYTDTKPGEFAMQAPLEEKFSQVYYRLDRLQSQNIPRSSQNIVILHSQGSSLPAPLKKILLSKAALESHS